MNDIIGIITDLLPLIVVVLLLLIIVLFIIVIVQGRGLSNLEKKYKKFMRGTTNKNIEELVLDYIDKVEESTKKSQDVLSYYNDLDTRVKKGLQKVALVRYKAFDDVGSDLSFSLAVLDDHNTGIIITGIYGRHDSTTYAKPVNEGVSKYDLSDEEKEALEKAMAK
jgi:hypothetical protein